MLCQRAPVKVEVVGRAEDEDTPDAVGVHLPICIPSALTAVSDGKHETKQLLTLANKRVSRMRRDDGARRRVRLALLRR
jgi:hypothetical protein